VEKGKFKKQVALLWSFENQLLAIRLYNYKKASKRI